jgi:hypothetical protein
MLGRPTLCLVTTLLCGCSGESARPDDSNAAGAAGSAGAAGAASAAGAAGAAGAASIAGAAGAANIAGAAGAASTAGAAGVAGAGVGVEPSAWPGPAEVQSLDDPAQFGGNLSGLSYEPAQGDAPAVLWAVSNIPGKLYRLIDNGSGYAADEGWGDGKVLRYPTGLGEADAEGVTFGASSSEGLYVVAEHDNDSASVSRLSVLRYDAAAPGEDLTATHEWELTAALPPFEANLGIEAVTWVPDDYLTERGFIDEQAGHAYSPQDYPSHGAGLFFVGVEQTGMVYGFALDHDSGASALLASITTRYPGVVGLEHDRDVGQLWLWCDDLCGNFASVFEIDGPDSPTAGRFTEHHWLARPSGLSNSNNEGIAIGSEAECSDGLKPFFWTDDNDAGGQSLRRGHVRCAGEL